MQNHSNLSRINNNIHIKPKNGSRQQLCCHLSQLSSKYNLIITIILFLTVILSTCFNNHNVYVTCSSDFNQASRFVDSSAFKPSIILILPQSFKVPTGANLHDDDDDLNNNKEKLQQYVAVINNVQNERDNELLRQQFKKLTLQIRDAKSPVTGQLFFEQVFDYFPANSKAQHLLIPINLDQVSATTEHFIRPSSSSSSSRDAKVTYNESPTIISNPQQLVVSIRPYQLADSGFGSENIELVSSHAIPVEPVPSSDAKHTFGIVQTDKPVYKPEDKVLIRALVVNEYLRAVTGTEVKIQIKNPHKVIVEEAKFPNINYFNNDSSSHTINHNKHNLFMDHVFEFPPEPMLGIWSVHLTSNDPVGNDTTIFELKEYVLPTYEIEFDAPKYITPNTQTIAGHIIAKYHYGKPVQGKAQFKFGYQETIHSRAKYIARSSIKNIDPSTGRVDYRISSEKFKESEWFPALTGFRLVVEVTVTEMSTGHREVSRDVSCVFLNFPFRISVEDSIEDFKPGLTQQLSVKVHEMQTFKSPPINSKILASFEDQNGTLLDANSLKPLNETHDFKVYSEAYTDSTGRASFNIGPVRNEITSLQMTIKFPNSTKARYDIPLAELLEKRAATGRYSANPDDNLAIIHHSLIKHDSPNGWIALMNKSLTTLNVGDQFVSDLLIRDAIVIPQKIFYIIMARGQILSLDTINSQGLVKFDITDEMIPSIRIVLFALTQDSVGMISDSMRVNIGQDLRCGLSMRYKSSSPLSMDSLSKGTNNNMVPTFRPSDKGKLAIKARQGDVVSLIGVDSAVYTIYNRTRLGSNHIVERVKKLDSGCGFGGGTGNLDVFYNAGLMYFNSVSNDNLYEVPLAARLGSICSTLVNQLRHLEDVQLGFARPMYMAVTQLNRMRSVELAKATRQKFASSNSGVSGLFRSKREIDVEAMLKKYTDPIHKSCCRLGTMEDLPQRRNCSIRARIVEKYMQSTFKECSQIYMECCREVFGEQLRLGSVITARDQAEPSVQSRIIQKYGSEKPAQYSDLSLLNNVGHLDRIESQTLVRKDFRETWLFDLVSVEQADGSATLDVQLPHSITSWSIIAMSINRYQPICFMPRSLDLITFQEIFLKISMPYKVIQGEQIDLVVTVFNYSPSNQEVLVYMYGVEDVCSEAEAGERGDRKRVRIDKHSSQSLVFPMIPLKIGKYPIKVLAITSTSKSSDIVEQYLKVVPRGKPVTDETTFSLDPMNQQRRSKRAIQTGNLVDEIDSSRGLQRSKVRLTPSRDSEFIVPRTQECIVSAIGDKMGQAVQTTMMDVENLIRLPHGCGEQVMIYLGPTLYTTRYLSSINKLTGEMRWRAIRYIQSGYKRILNFRKESGAFSAFARREPSIWLTAFVAKMLCQTERTPFIAEEILVDKTVVNMALDWLIDNQNHDTGTWVEMNPVYHREMLGGVLRENALTAFVTLTLNECAHHSPDLIEEKIIDPASEQQQRGSNSRFHHAQTNGIDKLKEATLKSEQALFLDRYKAVKERNPYVLALTSYALSFSRPKNAVLILEDLMSMAERSKSRNQLYWRGDYSIETAAYALQAIVELAPMIGVMTNTDSSGASRASWTPGADAVAISNWLSSRRSYSGAFESTQDTVVALEALSKFAQLQATPNGNGLLPQTQNNLASLSCNVTISNRTRRSIEFGGENSQVLQSFKLEPNEIETMSGEMLDIVTSGNGLGTMSVKLKYNVFQEEDELCRFNIDSSIEEWQPPKLPKHHSGQQQSSEQNGSDDLSKEQLTQPVVTTNTDQQSSNETIEDDYFKTFDKSMLSELNLIDLNQLSSSQNQADSASKPPSNGQKEVRKEVIVRFRRSSSSDSSRIIDLSTKNESTIKSSQDSWTSKVVSTLKSKLPSWLSPKPTTTTTPEPITPPATTSPTSVHSTLTDTRSYMSDAAKRSNASRRSTAQAFNQMVVHPTGIPVGAKLNTLSQHLEFNTNDTSLLLNSTIINAASAADSKLTTHQMVEHHSHKLVLLLRVCTHHMSIRRDSEMAVIEIGILSGFKPNEADLREIINDVGTPAMKFELSGDKSMVIIYMQYIPFSGPYCIQFRLIRDSLVYNLQSGYIRVYEYYSPTHSCSNFYTPSRVTDLIETKCDSSGQVCQCASKSLCPTTSKLLDLGAMHSFNSTNARNKLVELVCSDKYDFVALVRLKNVRYIEVAKMFKLSVKVKSNLKGNLTKIIEAQRQQKLQLNDSIRKPQHQPSITDYTNPLTDGVAASAISDDELEDTSLDHLNLNIDSTCIRNNPLLLHFAYPNQWKQGGELMILFGRFEKLEKRFFKITTKSPRSSPLISTSALPRPKAISEIGSNSNSNREDRKLTDEKTIQDAQMAAVAMFEGAQKLQYSLSMLLDKDSILHDITYQSKVEPRETINNLLFWLELRSRREKWTC